MSIEKKTPKKLTWWMDLQLIKQDTTVIQGVLNLLIIAFKVLKTCTDDLKSVITTLYDLKSGSIIFKEAEKIGGDHFFTLIL